VIFLIALSTSALLQWWLSLRHAAHVRAHRDAVPAAFSDRITLAEHQKAADYTVAGTRYERIELAYHTALLLGWTLGGGIALLHGFWQNWSLSPLWQGVALLVSAFALMSLLDLPLSAWHTFHHEQRFGFNRSTPALFVSDTLKSWLLTLAIGIPMAWVVLWLMQSAGQLWWLTVWMVWVGFSLLMMWAWPAFIAPLFNSFKPLEDEALKSRIQTLLQRCGFTSQGIFVMDGSRRSGHGNAYFTGLGNNKRIVFFDTLIESLEANELEAVLAHELGHFRRKHVLKRMLTMMAMSLAGLALLGWLIDRSWFYAGLGVDAQSHAIALLLFMLTSPVFGFLLGPVMARASRRHEFEADDYAAVQTDAAALIRALVKLYKENANTLTPDPWYSAFHDSHPPAPVRVGHLSAKLAPASREVTV
jgi:STE24 endopeptidase